MKGSKILEDVWLTICILQWLEIFCQAESMKWKIIYRKAVDWLDIACPDWKNYIDSAKAIF